MKRYRISKNFYLDEFVDFGTYLHYLNHNRLYKLAYKIDRNLIISLQKLRDEFDVPFTINNWWGLYKKTNFNNYETAKILKENKKKYNQWSGLRIPGKPYYNPDSMHSEFKAVDVHFYGIDRYKLNTIRQYVYEHWLELGITGMEVEVSWLHIDTRFIPSQTKLFVFNKTEHLPNWKPKTV